MFRLASIAALVLATTALAAAGAPRVAAKIRVGLKPCAAIQAYGAVWISNYGSATLSRVDPATNRVTERVAVGTGPFVVTEIAGEAWVPSWNGADIWRLRP